MKKEKISKPWAVYLSNFGPIGIGKIIEESKGSCYIQYSQNNHDPACWDPEWVKKFKTSKVAIDYFLNKNAQYSKRELKEIFLSNFPTKKKKLEKMLEQSLPKCTPDSCRTLGDEIGRVSHPYQ